MDDDPQTVHELLVQRAARQGPKPMLIERAQRITYAELDAGSRVLAAALVEAGARKGTRVGLIMPNGVAWAQIAAAVMRIGAVLVPLSTLLRPRELTAHLRTASVHVLIAVEGFRGHHYLDGLRPLTPELPALREVWRADKLFGTKPGRAATRIVDPLGDAVKPSDPLVIMFTSGSRGAPKGVIHSHGGGFGAVRSGLADRCIDAQTRLYIPMPFFWTGGFCGGLLSALLAGATLVTEAIPEPAATLRLLERDRVTLFRGWPDQAEALARQPADADLSALRPGSLDALLPAKLRAQPGARAKLFGMTESFGPYCGYRLDTDMPRSAWGSCGKPFPGIQVRIVDPGNGESVPAGTPGVIHLRGPHTLRGICRRSREEVFTADGFYPTGDLGHLDAEGFLFYHGRADDMFKVRGATVYPAEVEQALTSVDGVQKAFVTNVPGPDGDRVAAAVVLSPHVSTSREQLRDRTREVLSSFKVPTVWLLLGSDDAIPRGATGKVDVTRLRDLLMADDG
ncbi:MAG: acyl--CoA ligase [Mycobacteriaceae bacterium]|nr:acyl--CoA ligase [Mycobacteriaceae bacterium]